MAAVWPSGREDRGIRELVLWELQKGMGVLVIAMGRTGMPGKGLAVTWRLEARQPDQGMEALRVCETGDGRRSAAIVQRIMEVDDEEEVLELDKKPG